MSLIPSATAEHVARIRANSSRIRQLPMRSTLLWILWPRRIRWAWSGELQQTPCESNSIDDCRNPGTHTRPFLAHKKSSIRSTKSCCIRFCTRGWPHELQNTIHESNSVNNCRNHGTHAQPFLSYRNHQSTHNTIMVRFRFGTRGWSDELQKPITSPNFINNRRNCGTHTQHHFIRTAITDQRGTRSQCLQFCRRGLMRDMSYRKP